MTIAVRRKSVELLQVLYEAVEMLEDAGDEAGDGDSGAL
jgi:hypothetical protein